MTDLVSNALPVEDVAPRDDGSAHLGAQWVALRESGAPAAREALFLHYMPYARSIAATLYAARRRNDLEFDDLVQLANIGLIEAINRFDHARDVLFTTYCTPRIRGAVLDGIEKLSEAQEQLSFERRRRAERVGSLRGEAKGAKRLQQLGDLAAGLAIGFMLEGTGMFVQDADATWHYGEHYETAGWQQLGTRLRAALEVLGVNEKKVIAFHYFDGLAFAQIADLLGVSKGRISQLHRVGLEKMRASLPPDFSMQITG